MTQPTLVKGLKGVNHPARRFLLSKSATVMTCPEVSLPSGSKSVFESLHSGLECLPPIRVR